MLQLQLDNEVVSDIVVAPLYTSQMPTLYPCEL